MECWENKANSSFKFNMTVCVCVMMTHTLNVTICVYAHHMYCSHSETHKAGEFSAHPQRVVTLDMIYARCVIIVETWRLIYAHCVIIAETRRHSASSECCELPLPFHTGHFWQAVHSASAKCKVVKRKSKITKKKLHNCTVAQSKKLNTRTLGLALPLQPECKHY